MGKQWRRELSGRVPAETLILNTCTYTTCAMVEGRTERSGKKGKILRWGPIPAPRGRGREIEIGKRYEKG